MNLFKRGKYFLIFESKRFYWVFAFKSARKGFFFNGYLPQRETTYRLRVGSFEFERTNKWNSHSNMKDAWGDDYHLTVTAETLDEATSKATLADDDAVPSHLIKTKE